MVYEHGYNVVRGLEAQDVAESTPKCTANKCMTNLVHEYLLPSPVRTCLSLLLVYHWDHLP